MLFSTSASLCRSPMPRTRSRALVAGGGGRVVFGQLLDEADFVAGVGLAGRFADGEEFFDCLLVAHGCGRVVAG